MLTETFSFMLEGELQTVDLSPFGEHWDRSIGHEGRAEKASTVTHHILIMSAAAKRDRIRIKSHATQQFLASGKKDTVAVRKEFLEQNPAYAESTRITAFLDGALQAMLYNTLPRLRDIAAAARQGERGTGAIANTHANAVDAG